MLVQPTGCTVEYGNMLLAGLRCLTSHTSMARSEMTLSHCFMDVIY